MEGLTRIDILALLFREDATSDIDLSSSNDSTLKHRMFLAIPNSISSMVLPTPEKTIFSASPPARSTLSISPFETTSKPELLLESIFSIERFELAFTE